MNRFGHRFICLACLTALLFCLGFTTACSHEDAPVPAPTDELVVYVPPDFYLTHIMNRAKELFQSRFPDVALTYQAFGQGNQTPFLIGRNAEYQNYCSLLQSELTAGKGPDLIVLRDGDFPDLEKLLAAGSFCNLDRFLSADEDFTTDHFQQAVFNAGYRDGQRLYIPINYAHYSLGTLAQTEQAFGLAMQEELSFEDWSDQMIGHIQTHSLEDNRKLFHGWDQYEPYERLWINSCGLSVVDYQSKEFRIDTTAFRTYMEFYKAIYPNLIADWDGTVPSMYQAVTDVLHAVETGNLLYDLSYSGPGSMMNLFSYYLRYGPGMEGLRFYRLPVLAETEPFARPVYRAAIRSNSPNQTNAYEFIKILLSDDVQEMEGYLDIPVSNSALEEKKRDLTQYGYTEEDLDAVCDFLVSLPCRESNAPAVIDLVHTTMMPWIEDQRSYEDCLAELQSQLELYIHE